MQFKVESTGDITRTVKVKVSWGKLEEIEKKRYNELAPTIAIAGFRKGKVPHKIIEQHYGKSIRYDSLNDLVHDSYLEVIKNENLHPVGQPNVDLGDIKPGQEVEFTATFEVFPVIELHDIQGEKITIITSSINDADISRTLKNMQQQHVQWHEVNEAIKDGDRVTVDFEGKINGEVFNGGSGQNTPMVVGSKQFLPEFEQGVLGQKKGDNVIVPLTFPEDYHGKDVAGKTAEFTIHITKVEAPELPALDDEFSKLYGIASNSFDDLKKEVVKGMERELKDVIKNKTKQEVFNKLLEKNSFPIPQAFIEQEIDRLIEERKNMFYQYTGKKVNFDFPREGFNEQARVNVKLGLLMPELIKQYSIKKDDQRIREAIEEKAQAYDAPEETIRQMYASKEFMRQIEGAIMEDIIVEKLLENAIIEEKQQSYLDVMDKNKLAEEGDSNG